MSPATTTEDEGECKAPQPIQYPLIAEQQLRALKVDIVVYYFALLLLLCDP